VHGDLCKKGLGRAYRAARVATKYTHDLEDILRDIPVKIGQRYKNLAEQHKEGDWCWGSTEHHQQLEGLRQQVLEVRNRARDVHKRLPGR
jgi:hypothetical protein